MTTQTQTAGIFDAFFASLSKITVAPPSKDDASEDKPRRKSSKSEKEPAPPPAPPLPFVKLDAVGARNVFGALRAAGLRPIIDDSGEVRVSPVTGEIVMRYAGEREQRLDEAQILRDLSALPPDAPHGSALDNVVRAARFALCPRTPLAPPHRDPAAHAARFSVEGYIAGLPNHAQKLLADLAARERLAVSEECALSYLRSARAAGDAATWRRNVKEFEGTIVGERISALMSDPDALDHALAGFHALAAARVEAVRADIDALGMTPSVEDIERAYKVVSGRGAPTFEEPISILNTTPRDK